MVKKSIATKQSPGKIASKAKPDSVKSAVKRAAKGAAKGAAKLPAKPASKGLPEPRAGRFAPLGHVPLGHAPLGNVPPGNVPPGDAATGQVLDSLFETVLQRRTADPAISHSARLLARGTAKVAQKFGEEAVECLIEAVIGNKQALVSESADVLYHLMVLWAAAGLAPVDVWSELTRRQGVSGIAEKSARPRAMVTAAMTRKIP